MPKEQRMKNMAETSQEKKGNVIKGPWKRKPKIPRNIVQEIEDDIARENRFKQASNIQECF